MRKKLGEVLVERKLITQEQLRDALQLQQRHPMRLGAALVARGHLSESQLVAVLGSLLRVPVVGLYDLQPEAEALRLVHPAFAAEHDLLPLRLKRDRPHHLVLEVAMADPLNFRVIDELSFVTNAEVAPVLASLSDIDSAIRKHYGARLGSGAEGAAELVGLSNIDDAPEMTIVRRGGDEEQINTRTGEILSPFVGKPGGGEGPSGGPKSGAGATPLENARVALPRNDSALLLTEEVSGAIPEPEAETVIPPPRHVSVRTARASFDATLGALIDAAGEAVTAEAFLELERKFWALMRLLAKKGILTADEFLDELRAEGGPKKS